MGPMPGSSPGIESAAEVATPPPPGVVRIHCDDYSPKSLNSFEVMDLDAFLDEPRPEDVAVRWIHFDGLHPHVIDSVRRHFGLHTLAAEDVLRTPQRPKVESYDDHLFIVMRMLSLDGNRLDHQQISIFLYEGLLITFQERADDIWDPIRVRLANEPSRLRQQDASYLLYALLDALVDHSFPVLEQYGDHLEDLEEAVVENATPAIQREIHTVKRELGLLRRIIWPTREVIGFLQREEATAISAFAKTYMRDVHDHSMQVLDVVETYREMAAGLNDLYMSAVSNRMNEVMKVLTLMASFFIPITFFAGVYGMNFEYIPELSWRFSYAFFWGGCFSIVASLAIFFWRKGWIGRD